MKERRSCRMIMWLPSNITKIELHYQFLVEQCVLTYGHHIADRLYPKLCPRLTLLTVHTGSDIHTE